MKRSILALAVASAMVLTSGVVMAQRGQSGSKGPKTKVMQTSPKAGGGGSKSHAGSTQGPKVKTHGPQSAQTQTPKTHGKPTATTTTTTTTTTTKTTKTTTADPGTVTLSPVQQKLTKNTALASKLEGRLPAGTNLLDAAEGFRNLGQFVAAVNVSNNLKIPFTDLKSRMVDDGLSLGQAIKAERNDVDVTTVVRQAERDAQIMIDDDEKEMGKTSADRKASGKPKKGGGR